MSTDISGTFAETGRWSALLAFLEKWRTPLSPGDGVSTDELDAAEQQFGLPLPVALREWYLMAGRRNDLVRRQNQLVPPDGLYTKDATLIFMLENQDVVAWGVRLGDLHQADPAVIVALDFCYRQSDYDWVQENASVSSFVYQMIVLETTIGGEHAGWSLIDEGAVAKIEHHFKPLSFPAWHWPGYPNRIFGDQETLLDVVPDGDISQVYLTALTEESFRRAVDLLEIDPERY